MTALIDIGKTAIKKKDNDLANSIAGDIQVTPLNEDLKGIRVRSLLRASIEFEEPTSFTLAQEAIKILNTLPSINAEERATRHSPQEILNDPSSMLDSSEMARSFRNLGQRDFSLGISASDRIQHPQVRLFARLALVKGALGVKPVRPKPSGSKNKVGV